MRPSKLLLTGLMRRALPPPLVSPRPCCTAVPSTSHGCQFLFARALSTSSEEPVRLQVSPSSPYKKLSPIEHILLRPDTYIGSVIPQETVCLLWENDSLVSRPIVYPPALLKIVDEILVNAADNKQRDPNMSEIRINVDRDTGLLRVWNDGRGLPIEMHPDEGIPIPTLIFGHLMTSSNYNDEEMKTVGGRNGFGAKLCNINSKQFTLKTASSEQKLLFEQTWTNNMRAAGDPLLNEYEGPDFTEVSFIPDFARFGVKQWSDDFVHLLHRRAVDLAITLSGVRVYFDGQQIMLDSLTSYARKFVEADTEMFYSRPNRRWELVLAPSDSGFLQFSFVNNIHTIKGGRHVDYVVDQVVDVVKEVITQRTKRRNVPSQLVRSHLFVMVNCLIDNPTFDSQTKETLTTSVKRFGSSCLLNRGELKTFIEKSGIVEDIISELENKDKLPSRLSRKTSSLQISKLEDAYWAGGTKSDLCTLLVTEGDSAKALAVAGLEVIGRDKWGVFSVRGKPLNVSDADPEKVFANVEISSLCRILGLRRGFTYETEDETKTLRYGRMMILADQDEDGSHIKGLLINVIHHFWPALLKRDFVSSFVTPLLKARRGSSEISFFSQKDFADWKKITEDSHKWTVKYYKGLGTSSAAEAREYFSNLEKHTVFYRWEDGDAEQLDMLFRRENAGKRKWWIDERIQDLRCEDGSAGFSAPIVSYKSFIDNELIRFSLLDLQRSIPCLVDGLKPSQRKVLHTCLLHDRKEWKVSQLAAAVAQHMSYHHGEDSLVATIVRLAQCFVGSNNFPLLQPLGQFGTRAEGGEDAASARYIFTTLNPSSRRIFPQEDDAVLTLKSEENLVVEPVWYCPIIPFVLVNGCEGIGTGWSTRILPHSPIQVLDNVRRMIEGNEPEQLVPFFRGFRGNTRSLGYNRYAFEGILKINNENQRKNSPFIHVDITELPVMIWTCKYKERVLQPLVQSGIISSIKESHTEHGVAFNLDLRTDRLSGRRRRRRIDVETLSKTFKLTSTLSMNNMVLFDESGLLKKYTSTNEIFHDFYRVRHSKYWERKEHLRKEIAEKKEKVESQYRFVSMVVDGRIKLMGRSREEIGNQLLELGFKPEQSGGQHPSFSSLLRLPLMRLCREEVLRLESEMRSLDSQLEEISSKSIQSLWNADLDLLEQDLVKMSL